MFLTRSIYSRYMLGAEKKNPSVFLSYPTSGEPVTYQTLLPHENLGIGYISASLSKAGIENIIWAPRLGSLRGSIISWIEKGGLVLGFSPTLKTIRKSIDLAKETKAISPNLHVVLGGLHAGPLARQILTNYSCIDSIVIGEGEETIVELVKRVLSNDVLDGCKGIAHRNEAGNIIIESPRPLISSLDNIPFPKRIYSKENHFARVITSRGCDRHCIFCTTPERGNVYKTWRARSPNDVVEEFISLYNQGIRTIAVVDDDFLGGGEKAKWRAYEIADLLIKEKIPIKWFAFWRADTIDPNAKKDLSLLSRLRISGLERAFIGIEAGTDRALKLFGKQTTIKDNIKAIEVLRHFGIVPQIGYMMFHPYTTINELKANVDFLVSQKLDHAPIHFLRTMEVHPGTAIGKLLKKDGLLDDTAPTGIWEYRFQDQCVQNVYLSSRELVKSNIISQLGNVQYRLELAQSRADKDQWKVWDASISEIFNETREINRGFFSNLIYEASKGKEADKLKYLSIKYEHKLAAPLQKLLQIEQSIRDSGLSVPEDIVTKSDIPCNTLIKNSEEVLKKKYEKNKSVGILRWQI